MRSLSLSRFSSPWSPSNLPWTASAARATTISPTPSTASVAAWSAPACESSSASSASSSTSGFSTHCAAVTARRALGRRGSSPSSSTISATTGSTGSATRSGLFWASHVVHHQSEEFNLTTALRQPGTGAFTKLDLLPADGPLRHSRRRLPHGRRRSALLPVLAAHAPASAGWASSTAGFRRPRTTASTTRRTTSTWTGTTSASSCSGTICSAPSRTNCDDEPCIYGIRGQLKSWNPVWANLHYYWAMAEGLLARDLMARQVPGLVTHLRLAAGRRRRALSQTRLRPLTAISHASTRRAVSL